jgi:hypothetical protein
MLCLGVFEPGVDVVPRRGSARDESIIDTPKCLFDSCSLDRLTACKGIVDQPLPPFRKPSNQSAAVETELTHKEAEVTPTAEQRGLQRKLE